jgi:hypothetical protein
MKKDKKIIATFLVLIISAICLRIDNEVINIIGLLSFVIGIILICSLLFKKAKK